MILVDYLLYLICVYFLVFIFGFFCGYCFGFVFLVILILKYVLVILKYSGFNPCFLHEGDEVKLTSFENLTRQKSLTGVFLCLLKKGRLLNQAMKPTLN